MTVSLDERLAAADKKIAEKQKLVETVEQTPKVSSAWWSTSTAMTMSSVVMVFGLVVIALATYLILRGKSAEAVLRIFGTILIIVIAVFLVVAGYSDTQISPVMGLLGTVAGYLLGKEGREQARRGDNPQERSDRRGG